MDFEWNKNKADINVKKHGILFQEAATVFGDKLALTFNDPDHSIDEHRLLTFGVARTGKYVVVSHTDGHFDTNHQRTLDDKAREKDLLRRLS